MPNKARNRLPLLPRDVILFLVRENRLIIAGPPYPVFDGIQLPTPQISQTPGTPTQTSTANRLPPLTPADRERYRYMFANTGAQNGLLDGEQARTIFLRARLPNEVLGQIWYSYVERS